MYPDEIEQMLNRHIPDGFLRAAVNVVFLAHRQAHDLCKQEFAEQEAVNTIGYVRRGKIEGYLRDATARFDSLRAVDGKADHSGWNHVEVHGGPVIITCSTVPTPCALVDKADFRLTLAESNQPSLFDTSRLTADEPASLYALLLHSRSLWATREERQKFGHLPGSAYVAFPVPGLDYYVHEINLFERYSDVVAANLPKDWSNEATLRFIAQSRKQRIA